MFDTANEGKLARRLAVKFTDHSIDTLVPSFVTKDGVGTITKNELWIPLKVEDNSICKKFLD